MRRHETSRDVMRRHVLTMLHCFSLDETLFAQRLKSNYIRPRYIAMHWNSASTDSHEYKHTGLRSIFVQATLTREGRKADAWSWW